MSFFILVVAVSSQAKDVSFNYSMYLHISLLLKSGGQDPPAFLRQGSYAAVRETRKTLAKGSKSLGNTCLYFFSKQIAVIDDLFKICDN